MPNSKPSWLKINLPKGEEIKEYEKVKELGQDLKLHTICVEGKCPNKNECWGCGTASFLLLGDVCTRSCRFCSTKSSNCGVPLEKIKNEPENLAKIVKEMNLKYVVLTSVDRDDLQDYGAEHFANCIRSVRKINPKIIIETLIPDFQGKESSIRTIVESEPEVISHNLETVELLHSRVRDRRANYKTSLEVLEKVKKTNPKIFTKSAFMLGLGEKDEEIEKTMDDLREIDCDFLTIGQYLQPSEKHLEVEEFVTPEKFSYWKKIGEEKGFKYVASSPFVRSSYKAGEFYIQNVLSKR